MPVGFAATTQTAKNVIKEFNRNTKKRTTRLDHHTVKLNQGNYYKDQSKDLFDDLPDSEEILLTPQQYMSVYRNSSPNILKYSAYDENGELFEWKRSLNKNNSFIQDKYGCQTLARIDHGMWRVRVYNNHNNENDFTVNALLGTNYGYHPTAIKEAIIKKFGVEVYEKWKKLVTSEREIEVLRVLVQSLRISTQKIIASTTCCPSSKRLCKKAGLYIQGDIAYLLPIKYQY